MPRSLGSALPPDLLSVLSQADLPSHLGKGIPLVTVDVEGRPHPMLLSYLEVRALDPRVIRIAIGVESRSARNLAERKTGTFLIVEPTRTVYLKTRVRSGPSPVPGLPALGLFDLAVEDIQEDAPAAWEGGMRITSGITYAPAPSLAEPWAKATLLALANPPNG